MPDDHPAPDPVPVILVIESDAIPQTDEDTRQLEEQLREDGG